MSGQAPPDPTPAEPVNLAVALISPDGLRPLIANWDEVALYFIRGVQADAAADGTQETADLLQRLLAFPCIPRLAQMPLADSPGPVLAMHFRKDSTSLDLFTTIATLGTPQHVTVQELRIECFFPANEATARLLRGWAEGESPAR